MCSSQPPQNTWDFPLLFSFNRSFNFQATSAQQTELSLTANIQETVYTLIFDFSIVSRHVLPSLLSDPFPFYVASVPPSHHALYHHHHFDSRFLHSCTHLLPDIKSLTLLLLFDSPTRLISLSLANNIKNVMYRLWNCYAICRNVFSASLFSPQPIFSLLFSYFHCCFSESRGVWIAFSPSSLSCISLYDDEQNSSNNKQISYRCWYEEK